VGDVIDRLPQLGARAAYAKQAIRDALIDHKEYIYEHGEDAPEISGWTWGGKVTADLDSTEGDNIDSGVEAPVRN
jgi:xylulose-5-phosphate/fructose-6-phosphate phosphoketolase